MISRPCSSANSPSKAWRRALELTAPIAEKPHRIFPVVIQELADRFGDAPALIDDTGCLSFRTLAERTDLYARWALDQKLSRGDVVCLLMPNRADYLAVWLGIARVGAVVALINTNLTGASLIHAINIASPRHIIVDVSLGISFVDALPEMSDSMLCWAYGGEILEFPRIERAIALLGEVVSLYVEFPAPTLTDQALLIYTSGTTGLPKAAKVSHHRVMRWSHWFAGMMNTQPSDRIYNCLPMYHSVGGIVAITATLLGGGSVVLRPRFSASRFWEEIHNWECTLFQYIGDLCSYLVKSPPQPFETAHRLRLCCGNGLRPGVWMAFMERFRIPDILEFYASTEGSFSLYNCEGEPGSIGRIPPFLGHRAGIALVRFDTDTGLPSRTSDGFCVPSGVDEVGEALGEIDGGPAIGRFEGYADAEATQSKILRNVFAEGDTWFRTGDLMRKDGRGYFFFVDRIGDTFRWKGENVSSQEVAGTIASCPGVTTAVVYGVAIPGYDGRAGMVAVVPGEGFELATVRRHFAQHLPAYARPVFLRICSEVETTSTFRPRKQDLVADGFDPRATDDLLFVNDNAHEAFVAVDADMRTRILEGGMRL